MSQRIYSKFGPAFWTGDTGKALRRRGSEALLVAAYLITSPHSNMLGLYYQAIPYIAYETGLGDEGARKGLQACIDVGFCSFDEASEMVWVHEMAAWQIAESLKPADLRCKGVQTQYDQLPRCPFLEPFFDRYAQAFHLTRRSDERTPIQQSLLGPSEAPSKPGTGTGTGLRDTMLTHGCDLPPEARTADESMEGKTPKPKKAPACPHLAILALWQEAMPDMPQHLPTQWRGTRAIHLRTRWAETAAEKNWTDEGEGLAYFRKLFAYCRQSAFLTGKVPPRQGFKQFELELAWLVNPTNWAKVLEGKFHGEG